MWGLGCQVGSEPRGQFVIHNQGWKGRVGTWTAFTSCQSLTLANVVRIDPFRKLPDLLRQRESF